MVRVENHFDGVVEPREVLIHGIVHDFPDTVVQCRTVMGVAKVHSRPFSNRFKPLENLDASSVVIFTHFSTSKTYQNRGAAGIFCVARMPFSSYKIYCPPRGINIPPYMTEKR